MDEIRAPITVAIVAIITVLVQRKWGRKGFLWGLLVSAGIATSGNVLWVLYEFGFPNTRPVLFIFVVILYFVLIAGVSGLVILCVVAFAPCLLQDSSTEVNHFPFNLPTGKLENTYGLQGILRKYHELLDTFAIAFDTAFGSALDHPHRPVLREFFRSFAVHHASYMRQAGPFYRQFDRVPDALMKALAGADAVLAALDVLTTAQLSAIEECHRINTRLVKQQRFNVSPIIDGIQKNKLLIAIAAAVLGFFGVQKMGDVQPLISGINFTWADIAIVSLGLATLTIVYLFNILTFIPILRRLQAFEDLLTIAKAYRKGSAETTTPSIAPLLTATA
jgi:hypothetical protein